MDSDHAFFIISSILLLGIWLCGIVICGWIAINKSFIDGAVLGVLSTIAIGLVESLLIAWCSV